MLSIDDIIDLWNNDCIIDSNQLGNASTSTAKLHAKYISMLIPAKLKKTQLEAHYNTTKKLKIKYYRGEMSKEELKENNWDQYQFNKPLKAEIDDILRGDDDLIKITSRIEYMDHMIYLLESILGQIKQRDFQVSNHIKWKQFLAGN
jgi:hypothetical protein